MQVRERDRDLPERLEERRQARRAAPALDHDRRRALHHRGVGHRREGLRAGRHPRAIADRLIRFAKIVGRENVIAGTDCGIGSRVGHPQVGWAKFQAMAEGARIATKELWMREAS